MKNIKKEYIYAIISILLWSTTATVTKLLLNNLNRLQVLFVTSTFASLFLLIINIFKKNLKQLKSLRIRDYIQLALIGLLGTFLYTLFFYIGINKMQASQAFIINYLWPIMSVVFACIILKEKVTLKKFLAIIISFIGVLIVTSNGNIFNISSNSLIGSIYCILAAVAYGLFTVLNKKVKYDTFLSMMIFYFSSAIVSLIYIIITKNWISIEITQFAGLIWLGFFTSAIAFTSWAIALEKGNTAKISNLAYITPFLSLIWTSIVLKETVSIYSLIGLVVIILGVLIQLKD